MMVRNRPFGLGLALALLCDAVSSLYFPMPVTNITLPSLDGFDRPLPPVLRLHAVLEGSEDPEFKLNSGASAGLFRIRDERLIIEENRLPRRIGKENLLLEVRDKSRGIKSDTATVNINFSDREMRCDDFRRELCFWTGGKFKIRRGQTPVSIGYLSSEFLQRRCQNHSVAYQVIGAEGHVRADRVRNTNSDSWILSLIRKIDKDRTNPIVGEIICSVTSEKSSATYRRPLEVAMIDEMNPKPFDFQQVNESAAPASNSLESMSLIFHEGDGPRAVPIGYPESVEVSRSVAFAFRVAQPFTIRKESKKFMKESQMRDIADSGIKFRMENQDIFRITEKGGIIYVNEPHRLKNLTSVSVHLTWTYPKGFTLDTVLTINIIDTAESTCGRKANDIKSRKSCSQRTSQEECLRTCGISTGFLNKTAKKLLSSLGCHWQNNERPEALSVNYQTCSPDLKTCPDRFCDPLEQLFPGICPQDCTDYVYGSANKEPSVPGISSAAGVCTCSMDSGQQSCTCGLMEPKKRQGKARKTSVLDKSKVSPFPSQNDLNVSVVEGLYSKCHPQQRTSSKVNSANTERCGMVCLSSILGGSLIFIISISTLLMVLYHRRLKKRCPNQGPLKEDMININYEEYLDRSADTFRIAGQNVVVDSKPDYYDKKWEFPRYRLIFEETIGEGEFGKVLKAKAEGINGINGSTTVAVKTLKENAKESELADLISEYQLLKEVDHPNIIHLLGACTTLDGPLYVIIEYAKHGSLRNYLRRNRHFGSELHLNDKETETSYMLSITPKDILTFAWQISKGMAYLTEMKLVHRDLAARNVLITEGLICKISDFGLTRDIYEDDTYLKRSKGRVPVKWMALESLSDHVYTTKSDVWSYGIVLWELVTTGGNPYPGIAVQNLFHLLKSGYRMEKPINCSPELYHIMRTCWHENPSHRPTFKSLVSKLEDMLSEGRDYLDLNTRIIENQTYFSDFANESEPFMPATENGVTDKKTIKWRFGFTDNATESCACSQGECKCSFMPRRDSGVLHGKPKYENEITEDSCYVQPKGEPKPVNSCLSDKDSSNNNGLTTENFYIEGNMKKVCETKKI